MNPTAVPSVTLPRIEKPAKQSADIINFYSKSKEKALLAVLVFIFSFFSVAEAITKKDLEKRGIYVKCTDVLKSYSDDLLKYPKFQGLALNHKAQCNISKNEFAEAKQNLKDAIRTFPDDLVSAYLLLQIKFQESLETNSGVPEIDMELYKDLMNKVKDDWPKRDFDSDPYYYIQEVGAILTPYLIVLVYDFYKNSAGDYKESRTIGDQLVGLIGDKKSCNDIITKVDVKLKQYKIENADNKYKPINNSSYEAYSKQAGIVKEIVCEEKMEDMINAFSGSN